MSIRVTTLMLVVAALSAYAWRDWFKSLCGLILLTVFLEHRDMPRSIFGIQGLNPWNILAVAILVPWLVRRREEGHRWDIPRKGSWLFGAYFLVAIVAYLRAAIDVGSFPAEYGITLGSLTSNEFANPFKYLLPGIMLYDGCRTRQRLQMAVVCVLLVGVVYALLVIRWMPLSVLFDESNFMRHRPRISREVGLNPNDIAMLFVGSFWAIVASLGLWRTWALRVIASGAAVAVFLAMALCHSRAGYVSFVGVGLLFGLFRWRPLLAILPAAVLMVCLAMPSIPARLGMGFGVTDAAGEDVEDWAEVTSGRTTTIWPPVIGQILSSPLLGQGRRAILRTGVYEKILATDGVCPDHPHNAYLEVLLDAGLVGLVSVVWLYFWLVWLAIRLGRDRGEPLVRVVGGMALAALGTLLITGLSSQSLFPTISMMGMWCTCGMLVRVSVMQRQQSAPRYRSPSGLGASPGGPSPAAGVRRD